MTKPSVVPFCNTITTTECIERQRAAKAVFSGTRVMLIGWMPSQSPALWWSARAGMGAECTHNSMNRWDLHMKISEAHITRFISERPLSFNFFLCMTCLLFFFLF